MISSLLLVSIVVSVSVLVYLWSYTQLDMLSNSFRMEVDFGELYLREDWTVEDAWIDGSWLRMFVTNTGDVELVIEDVLFNDTLVASNLYTSIVPGDGAWINVSLGVAADRGYVTLVSERGRTQTFRVSRGFEGG